MPPIHMPFFLEAAILSRMRSPVTSRSNWAKDSSTLSVSRPMEVVVLNCWVTETNETPRRRRSRRAWQSRRASGSAGRPCRRRRCRPGRPRYRPAAAAAPAAPWCRRRTRHHHKRRQTASSPRASATDEGLAGFALRVERVEFLLQPLLGGFAGVDRAADPFGGPSRRLSEFSHHAPPLTGRSALLQAAQRSAGPTSAPR